MAAFEFGNTSGHLHDRDDERRANAVQEAQEGEGRPDPRRLRQECIIAFKVYDQCRQQDCLTEEEIGPARAAECKTICEEHYTEGAIIDPPSKDGGS